MAILQPSMLDGLWTAGMQPVPGVGAGRDVAVGVGVGVDVGVWVGCGERGGTRRGVDEGVGVKVGGLVGVHVGVALGLGLGGRVNVGVGLGGSVGGGGVSVGVEIGVGVGKAAWAGVLAAGVLIWVTGVAVGTRTRVAVTVVAASGACVGCDRLETGVVVGFIAAGVPAVIAASPGAGAWMNGSRQQHSLRLPVRNMAESASPRRWFCAEEFIAGCSRGRRTGNRAVRLVLGESSCGGKPAKS